MTSEIRTPGSPIIRQPGEAPEVSRFQAFKQKIQKIFERSIPRVWRTNRIVKIASVAVVVSTTGIVAMKYLFPLFQSVPRWTVV